MSIDHTNEPDAATTYLFELQKYVAYYNLQAKSDSKQDLEDAVRNHDRNKVTILQQLIRDSGLILQNLCILAWLLATKGVPALLGLAGCVGILLLILAVCIMGIGAVVWVVRETWRLQMIA